MMNRIKVLICFGTRPEAIKMAPLIKELEGDDRVETIVCVTAQHRHMLDQVLEAFSIKPQFDMDIMRKSQSLTHITNAVLAGLEEITGSCRPDLVLVHGDTTTTFASSLSGYYSKIDVGHVEAGLRTGNKYSPFPEEMNRRLTSAIAGIHFAPTKNNRKNLLLENISAEKIFITGNTAIDALKTTVKDDYVFANDLLNKIEYSKKRVITLTAHRRENLGSPLEEIFRAVRRIADEFVDTEVIYPVHLNPAVREAAGKILGRAGNISLIEPLDVLDMHNLMARSYFVMTDSGGIQEEAPSLGKPVLVLRTETERPEAVEAGTVKVVGVKENDVYREASKLLSCPFEYKSMANRTNPYGDGKASLRIKNAILFFYGIIMERPKDWDPKDGQ
jgi:UDP-N-acetylglucosamine 2-epimerase (non-hydrolysing)